MQAPRKVRSLLSGTAAILSLGVFVAAPNAVADDAASQITAALAQWTDDFNARRTDKVCDLSRPRSAPTFAVRLSGTTPPYATCW